MTKVRNPAHGAEATVRAAQRFTRRTLFRRTALLGTAAAIGPWYVRDALSSSGTLSVLNWDDELPNPVIPDFEKATGIRVRTTPFSQNEEQINKLRATDGEGFDVCQPTANRAPQYRDLDVLAPLDTNRLNLDALLPAFLGLSQRLWTWDGKLHHLPHCWGSEAISWRTDLTTLKYETLSYGTLWEEQYRGKVQGRPMSLLTTIGLWMDATGRLPSNRMLDAYKDSDNARRIFDQILAFAIPRKPWIKQFWDSADSTKSGLLTNGVVIGQTWDGPALSLKREGRPVSYMAPQEGALAWLDGWAITKAAKNVPQAYEWLKYITTPEVSAKVANGSGYNPIAKGADAFLSDVAKKNFAEAYPGDALQKVWPWPPEPGWFAEIRTQYAEKFKGA
jgi:spermidine/putrescine transport system substrate-binding protein